MAADIPIEGKTVKALTVLSVKRTYDLFAGNRSAAIPLDEERCARFDPLCIHTRSSNAPPNHSAPSTSPTAAAQAGDKVAGR
jgi:hypothetical protein